MSTHPARRPGVVVLGGGLAGLSAAFHLGKRRPVTVIEKSRTPGGTARSFEIGGFTFDFTGHLLHLHHPYTKRLISSLLRGNLLRRYRSAWIYSHSARTPYPFQANTFGLPDRVVRECVTGFLNRRPPAPPKDYSRYRFDRWCLGTFGEGISRHFMFPYNEKLWRRRPSEMSADWCGPFVPTPALSDIVRGALTKQKILFGYNTSFLYPRRGGIQVLPEAIAERLSDLRLGLSAEEVDWRRKRVRISSGEWLPYAHLVNTLPLVELLKRMDLPAGVERAASKLEWTSVMCLNVGVSRPRISEASWIYFPEKRFRFYRAGFPMNFTPHAVPEGCSSMYVEVSYDPGREPARERLWGEVRAGLEAAGILRRTDRIPVLQFLPIPYAYVIYNRRRAEALQTILPFLASRRIQTIGRYGAWKYSFMEAAILDGKAAADKIVGSSKFQVSS